MTEQQNTNWYNEINSIDVGSDKKNDKNDVCLRKVAIEILNSDDVKKMNPDQFNKLKNAIKELLKSKDVNEKLIRDQFAMKRLELSSEIRKKSEEKSEERGYSGKLLNFAYENLALAYINAQSLLGNEYILDYDSNNGNQAKTVAEFEQELISKPIEKINAKGIASYLVFLKGKGKLESFFQKLSEQNRYFLAMIWYLDKGNGSLVKNILKKERKTSIIGEVKKQFNGIIIDRFKFEGTQKYIYEKYKNNFGKESFESFANKMNACKSAENILGLLKTYNINFSKTNDIKKIFGMIKEDIKNKKERLQKKITQKEKETGIIGIKDKKIVELLGQDSPKELESKRLKDLNIEELEIIKAEIKDKNILSYINLVIETKTHDKQSSKIERQATQILKGKNAEKVMKTYVASNKRDIEKNLKPTIDAIVEIGEKEDSSKRKSPTQENKSKSTEKSTEPLNAQQARDISATMEQSSVISIPKNFGSIDKGLYFKELLKTVQKDGEKTIINPSGVSFKLFKDGTNFGISYGGIEHKGLKGKEVKNAISFASFSTKIGLNFLIPYAGKIINKINEKEKLIEDVDGLNDQEKNAILGKLGTAIIPGYVQKVEVQENIGQFKNVKNGVDYNNSKYSSIESLAESKFPAGGGQIDFEQLIKTIG